MSFKVNLSFQTNCVSNSIGMINAPAPVGSETKALSKVLPMSLMGGWPIVTSSLISEQKIQTTYSFKSGLHKGAQ